MPIYFWDKLLAKNKRTIHIQGGSGQNTMITRSKFAKAVLVEESAEYYQYHQPSTSRIVKETIPQ